MKMFYCDAVLFDLDGVLVDSIDCIKRHWANWAGRHGIDIDLLDRVAHGRRSIDIIRLVAPHLSAVEENDVISAAEASDTDGLREIPGADALVRSLPPDTWAVATSGSLAIATARMKRNGLPVPGVIVTADDVEAGKPDPAPYLLAAERLGVEPHRCIVFEDAPAGVEAGLAGGMQVIAITSTHSADLLANADAVLNRLSDVQIRVENGEADCRLTVLTR